MGHTRDIPISPALDAYFWAHVQRDEITGCLYWMGAYDRQGYGVLTWHRRSYRAARIAYCLHHQGTEIPPGLVADPLCRIPPCVEWAHLEAVTVAEKTRRGRSTDIMRACAAQRRTRTHCRNGHPLSGDNRILQTQKGGIRQRCRLCYNARRRTYMQQYRPEHAEAFKAYRLRYKQVT